MANDNTDSDKSEPQTQIKLAIIGLIGTIAGIVGTIGVAMISNWDKMFLNNPGNNSSNNLEISNLKKEIEKSNQIREEQNQKIQELQSKLDEMNKDIAMNPSAAMSFLPYALRTIGAMDGTIDCATPVSDALKDLACQQIQTLLNSVNSSYKLTQQRKDVRPQVMDYQSENGLNMGKDSRKAGMLDEQTLKFLIQERLTDVDSQKSVEDYFP